VKESELGEDHPDVATSLNNLAQLHMARSRYLEAAPLLERSLAIQEKALGAEHAVLGRTLTLLGEVYRHLGREDALFEVEARKRLLREEDSRPK
jgi:tetratricopeptide (TPR) repeat protein